MINMENLFEISDLGQTFHEHLKGRKHVYLGHQRKVFTIILNIIKKVFWYNFSNSLFDLQSFKSFQIILVQAKNKTYLFP